VNNNPGGAETAASRQPWRVRPDGSVVLIASRVAQRHTLHFPPLPALSPLTANSELVELDGVPTLYSYTIVHFSPKVNKAPVVLGQVDYPQGVRVFGRLNISGARRPVIGEPLRAVLQQEGEAAIYAFEACEEHMS
jgi:uncharacterized OB-fold protein